MRPRSSDGALCYVNSADCKMLVSSHTYITDINICYCLVCLSILLLHSVPYFSYLAYVNSVHFSQTVDEAWPKGSGKEIVLDGDERNILRPFRCWRRSRSDPTNSGEAAIVWRQVNP